MTACRPAREDACDVFHLDAAKVKKVRAGLMGPATVAALADTFKMLGDNTRVRLLDALAKAELCVCDLANLVGLSESAVSHQLRLLRGMRLVRPRREGRMVFYALDDQHIISLFQQALRHVEEHTERARSTPPAGAGGPREAPGSPTRPARWGGPTEGSAPNTRRPVRAAGRTPRAPRNAGRQPHAS